MMKLQTDWRLPGLLLVAALFAGCASDGGNSGRYAMSQDRGPTDDVDVSSVVSAVPRYEEPRSAGNKSPYMVWGKRYQVMARASAEGYVESGTASWYGKKFHGHRTSNGETYDMYEMSAAHKGLPLPSYARVTNLDNGRSVVVRVNDRGPFHGDRLIDLSWAAAKKLDFLGSGTARVEVAVITVRPDGSMTLAGQAWSSGGGGTDDARDGPASPEVPAASGDALFVQLGSFSRVAPARQLEQTVRQRTGEPVRVRRVTMASGEFHRVQVGPFGDAVDAERAMERLASEGFPQAMVLTDSH
jgi:rare lipoprotein A